MHEKDIIGKYHMGFRGQVPAAATDIVSTDPNSVVTVGEDGSVFEYSVKTKEVVRSLGKVVV